jgi:20S proteasome subunit beta 7
MCYSFLGQVDLYGTAFQDSTLATGYGAHIARPLLRKAYRPDLSEAEARQVLEDCMRVMFYRDARTINRIQLAKVPCVAHTQRTQQTHTASDLTDSRLPSSQVTAEGPVVSEPYSLVTEWTNNESALGYPRPE